LIGWLKMTSMMLKLHEQILFV